MFEVDNIGFRLGQRQNYTTFNVGRIFYAKKKTEKHSVSDSLVINPISDKTTLDISVYRTNEEKIEIRFDILAHVKKADLLPLKLQEPFIKHIREFDYYNNESARILEEIFYYSDSTEPMFDASEVVFSEITDSNLNSYISSSITYQVATSPHVVLNWLGCFSEYLHIHLWQLKCVHLKNTMGPLTLGGHDNKVSMQEYMEFENFVKGGVQLKLLENILLLKQDKSKLGEKNDPYQEVLNALQIVTENYRAGRKKGIIFLKYIDLESRCTIFFDKITSEIFNTNISESQRQDALLRTAKEFIAKNQKTELNFLINCLNYRARKLLFSQCINKLANNGMSYKWINSEWCCFLKYAEFSLKNQKISIINLKKNPGYMLVYTQGDLLQTDMEHLAKTLGLEFEPDCNFHSELIFTKESTIKLQKMGLGIFGLMEECKKLLYKNNFWSFFSRSKVDKDNGKTNILDLDIDIFSVIQEKMELYRTLP